MPSPNFIAEACLLKMILGIASQVIFFTVILLKILGGCFLFYSISPRQWAKVVLNLTWKFWFFACEYVPEGSQITYQVEASPEELEAGIFEKGFKEQGY